jgi:cellulose synthase/poly-beta-1,6-N-acetylglucosamine synthase-like glycosyltransferase
VDTWFYVSVGFIAYTYVVYPVFIVVWGTVFPKRVEKRYQTLPLSVVLAVKNEEINIRVRLENLLNQDYPRDLVEVIVVSDGSTDRTVELARQWEDERVKVVELEVSVGKSGALNHGIDAATNDIVVFADARQRFGENVFAELVAMFADERVGAVSGELVIEPGAGSEVHEGVGMYWKYEKLIRRMESAANSTVGATGSIYAIRKHLYVPLEAHALLDDFLIPMRIVLQGFRVIFVRSARAFDIASSTAKQEFARKVRTLAGNFQAVAMEKRLMDPFKNRVFLQFISHKIFRLLVPYFCVLALVTSALSSSPVLRLLFVLQVVFYAFGTLNRTRFGESKIGALSRVSWTFMVLNAAAVMGLWVFVRGRDRSVWKKA